MPSTEPFAAGGYRFIPFQFQYSGGVVAEPGFRIERARFRRPLTYPDTISVGARVVELGDDRFTLDHKIVSHAQQAVVTEGQGTVVTYHHAEGRKVPLPEELRERIAALEASARRDGLTGAG